MRPRDSVTMSIKDWLTRHKRHLLELLLPVRRDPDYLRLLALLTGEVADLVRVLDNFLHVFSAQRVEHVEGVCPVWLYTLLVGVGKVLEHFRVLLDQRPN